MIQGRLHQSCKLTRQFVPLKGATCFGFVCLHVILGVFVLNAGGCSSAQTIGLTLDMPMDRVRQIQNRMQAEPVDPARPIVVLGGWRAWRPSAGGLARRIRKNVGGPHSKIIDISFPFYNDLDAMAEHVIAEIDRRWPSDDPERTTQVDVIGVSMGGLVARRAAMLEGRKLNIKRLFTIGTPHRGAKLARFITVDKPSADMKPGSVFLGLLDQGLEGKDYELICYARDTDDWVGTTNSAPVGFDLIVTPGPMLLSHQTITTDARMITDIASRLRGEFPLLARTKPD